MQEFSRATETKQKALLHKFLLTICKEQTIMFTKRFKLKGETTKINKLKIELTSVINKGGKIEVI